MGMRIPTFPAPNCFDFWTDWNLHLISEKMESRSLYNVQQKLYRLDSEFSERDAYMKTWQQIVSTTLVTLALSFTDNK